MSLRTIITEANPILRKKAVRVSDFDNPEFQTLVDDMIETMLEAPGVGLAAPQVAISQRLIVVKLPDDPDYREEYGDLVDQVFVVANPKITKASKEKVEGVEGCLSIPGYAGRVSRHVAIEVKGQDRRGNPFAISAKNWLARIFQHEIDHLDGVLFTDLTDDVWETPPAQDEDAEVEAEHETIS